MNASGRNLVRLDNEDLFEQIRKYAEALGTHFGSLTEEERKKFRDLRGGQGQITRTRRCQLAIREHIPAFNPSGLDEFLQQEKAETNKQGKEIIDRVETALQKMVVEELRREFGGDETEWWTLGVPKTVRQKVAQCFEDEDGKRGGKEYYFDLIDYRSIAVNNWELFEPLLAYGKSGNKR